MNALHSPADVSFVPRISTVGDDARHDGRVRTNHHDPTGKILGLGVTLSNYRMSQGGRKTF